MVGCEGRRIDGDGGSRADVRVKLGGSRDPLESGTYRNPLEPIDSLLESLDFRNTLESSEI